MATIRAKTSHILLHAEVLLSWRDAKKTFGFLVAAQLACSSVTFRDKWR